MLKWLERTRRPISPPNRTRIWRNGDCPFSAFFVFDEENVPSATFMRAARETYPLEVAYGIIFTKENGRKVAEIALSSEKYVDHAVTEGIKWASLPCSAPALSVPKPK